MENSKDNQVRTDQANIQNKLEAKYNDYLQLFRKKYSNHCSYFSKLFLKPMEIALKESWLDNSTQIQLIKFLTKDFMANSPKKNDYGFGLCSVTRNNKLQDKSGDRISERRKLQIIRYPDFKAHLQRLKQIQTELPQCLPNRRKDLIKQRRQILKSRSLLQLYSSRVENGQKKRIKVAICVCVYSEQDEMLKRTLAGINANYTSFMNAGVKPEEIAVVFIFDGIEKVSKSVADFMGHMDAENNFKWKKYAKDLLTFAHTSSDEKDQHSVYDPQSLNVYSREEVAQIEGRLFKCLSAEYAENKKLLAAVRELKGKKGLTYQELPDIVQKEYKAALKKQMKSTISKSTSGQSNQNCEATARRTKIINQTVEIQKQQDVIKYFQPPCFDGVRERYMMFALAEVQGYLERYFQSRQDTALLYSYRYQVDDLGSIIQGNDNTPNNNINKTANDDQQNILQQTQEGEYNKLQTYIFMCVKHTNGGKLSSQKWFFQGFCQQFQCETAILLDVGLKPEKDALFRFYKHLSMNENCGGVCGYMGLAIQRPFNDLGYYHEYRRLDALTRLSQTLFDIQKAQRFEYHFAHMLDKPFESFFGFINVLPGAFSGYNMDKLFKDNQILDNYFASLNSKDQKINFQMDSFGSLFLSIFFPRPWVEWLYRKAASNNSLKSEQTFNQSMASTEQRMIQNQSTPKQKQKQLLVKTPYEAMKYKNVCLAEDRILCLGIHQKGMKMAFLPDAWATVDSVTSLQNLMAQRRRWNNGSYFAFEEVVTRADIGCKDIGFAIQMLFCLFSSALSYISIALFYLTLDMTAATFAREVLKPLFYRLYDVKSDAQLSKCVFIFADAYKFVQSVPDIISFFYSMMVGGMVFFSLSLNQTNLYFERTYNKICSLLGWYSILMYVMLCVNIFGPSKILDIEDQQSLISSDTLKLLVEVILATQAVPPIFFFLFVKRDFRFLWEIAISAPSYIFYGASYLHVLNIYAICRVDDLSWGTKGLTSGDGEKTKLKQAWETQKYIFVCRFLTWNIMVAIALKLLVAVPSYKSIVIVVLSGTVGFSLVFRLVFAVLYLIYYKLSTWWNSQKVADRKNQQHTSAFQDIYKDFEHYLMQDACAAYEDMLNNVRDLLVHGVDGQNVDSILKRFLRGISSATNKMNRLMVAQLNSVETTSHKSAEPPSDFMDLLVSNSQTKQRKSTLRLSKIPIQIKLQNEQKGSGRQSEAKRPSQFKRLPPIEKVPCQLTPNKPTVFNQNSSIKQPSSIEMSNKFQETAIKFI